MLKRLELPGLMVAALGIGTGVSALIVGVAITVADVMVRMG